MKLWIQRDTTMAHHIAQRLAQVTTSPTLAISAKAKAMKAAGEDVIALSAGEPDFDTPEHIRQAAHQAIHDGLTRYTAVDGVPELKKAICEKYQRDNALHYKAENILVSSGAKQSLYNLFQACINPGDEVIIPTPYWVSYPAMVHLAGGTPIKVHTDISTCFKITPDALAAAITPNTKMVILNSPSNPTGQTYTTDEITLLGKTLQQHPDVLVVSDDIYEHMVWHHGPSTTIVQACPELQVRSIMINGVSKAYAMTGWRIGYAAGPSEIIAAMKKIQSQSTSNPNSIAQQAALAALTGPQDCVTQMRDAFKQRHDAVHEQLNAIAGITAIPSDGTFYIFPNIENAMQEHGIATDIDFADQLLVKHGVATVPGTAFGAPGHLRLSFASAMPQLEEALVRLKAFCEG